jgi:hypothetical protein
VNEIAQYGWDQRARFYPTLTPLDEAVEKAVAAGRDPALPALAFADVADNPGGGGRGNTMYLLRAFAEAGVKGALMGVIYDPPLAAEAHAHGLHCESSGGVLAVEWLLYVVVGYVVLLLLIGVPHTLFGLPKWWLEPSDRHKKENDSAR